MHAVARVVAEAYRESTSSLTERNILLRVARSILYLTPFFFLLSFFHCEKGCGMDIFRREVYSSLFSLFLGFDL